MIFSQREHREDGIRGNWKGGGVEQVGVITIG